MPADQKFNRLLGALCLAGDALFSHTPLCYNKKHVLIACMPKSGSTFLATSLANLQGLRRARLIPAWDGREQELCPIRLSRYNHIHYISQHHTRFSHTTQNLIEQYKLRPVVLVRNLADCLASLRDYMRTEKAQSPHVYITEAHRNMPDDVFETFLAKTALPWYVHFYLGWRGADKKLIIDYDDLNTAPIETLLNVTRYAGLQADHAACAKALEAAQSNRTRLNVGIIGRGAQLSLPARTAIGALLDFYPEYAQDPLFVKTRESLQL